MSISASSGKKRSILGKLLRYGGSRSFKVIDRIGINRKPLCDFLFVFHCNYVPIFYRFRYICLKLATCNQRPRSGRPSRNFAPVYTCRKARIMGLPGSEIFVDDIVTPFAVNSIHAWTDGRIWYSKDAICISDAMSSASRTYYAM